MEMIERARKRLGASKLVLASVSPQRKRLLAEAGVAFEVIAPRLAEPAEGLGGVSPTQQAEAAAYFKARSVAEEHPAAVVLGADTVVAADGHVLGKPAEHAEALQMLRTLSGTRHAVTTGVALLGPGSRRRISSATTYVTMRDISEAEAEAYVASGEWADKAGGYAIQETADRFVKVVDGSFTNVVGLPMELVGRMLDAAQGHSDTAGCSR